MKRSISAKTGMQREKEKSVESAIRTLAELYGWRVYKTDVFRGVEVRYPGSDKTRRFSEGTTGQPDLVMFPAGGGLHVETKALDGKLSAKQRIFHEVLRKDGYEVIVPRSLEHFKALMDEILPGWKTVRHHGIRLRDWIGGQ